MKILILRFSSIGDIVLTTPIIRTLKTQLEDAEIHFATKFVNQSILQENPYIDKLHLLQDNENELIQQLKSENFDCIVDLHNNLRTLIIRLKLGVKSYKFDKLNFKKWIYTNFKIDLLPNTHIIDRYYDAVSNLGIKPDSLGLDYFIPEKDIVQNSWLPKTHQNGYVSVVVGATYETKRLPLKRLIELCGRINKPIILLGGKDDEFIANDVERFFGEQKNNALSEKDIIRKLGKQTIIFNACGKFNLNQSASLIKNASVVFSHDTGLMHIAAAFKKHIYSIWGNTSPKFGMYPYRTTFVVFENNKLKCRPCSKIGYQKCPKKHFKCMNELVFDFYLKD
jgi:ADP-heptose:LPS heptosyltransferase